MSTSPHGGRRAHYVSTSVVNTAESEPFLTQGHESRDVELGAYPGESFRSGNGVAKSPASSADGEDGFAPVGRAASPYKARGGWWMAACSLFRNLSTEKPIGCGRRKLSHHTAGRPWSRILTGSLRLLALLLMFFGILQFVGIVLGLLTTLSPGRFHDIWASWRGFSDDDDLRHWPTDWTADVVPVQCHSHNDYWRKVPLKSAIKAGCVGVEADVWLIDEELYVGHSRASLSANRTLTSLYVNPLLEILDYQNPVTEFHTVLDVPRNGVFDTDPQQTLVLLIDFKTNGGALWPVVSSQLEALRTKQYLTYFNGTSLVRGPVTVVATGNAPFDLVVANQTYRDMFFDAPLISMAKLEAETAVPNHLLYDVTEERAYLDSIQDYEPSTSADQGQGLSGPAPSSPSIYSPFNSYYASTSLTASIGVPLPYFSSSQRSTIEAQIRGAHSLGLHARYWEVPAWPVSWRNYLWRELTKLGEDILNVDDLDGATKGDWRSTGNGRLIWGKGEW